MRLLVINGPNINMLGTREPDIYGKGTYIELVRMIESCCAGKGVGVECRQSNYEGDLVTWIQNALDEFDGIIINPAAYTHTSIALLDAVKAVGLPVVEVHISDVSAREEFRRISYIRPACIKTITGQGFDGYLQAVDALIQALDEKAQQQENREDREDGHNED